MVMQSTKFDEPKEVIVRWADRHRGIGFDQLLIVEPTRNSQSDFFYRIFNADGCEVMQCGNGACCVALFLQREQLTTKNQICLQTQSGYLELTVAQPQVTVNLGVPKFHPEQIPLHAEPELRYTLTINHQTIHFCALSLGNPHCIVNVSCIDDAQVATLGATLSQHEVFPEQTNVAFMQCLDRQTIRLRVYERGVGETQACGSGACAAVIAGRLLNLLDDSVTVHFKLGTVQVHWEKHEPVFLTGNPSFVFKGYLQDPA